MECNNRLKPMTTLGDCLLVTVKKTGERKGGLHKEHAEKWLLRNDPEANLYYVGPYTEPPEILIVPKR
jgi:hypothetical protein